MPKTLLSIPRGGLAPATDREAAAAPPLIRFRDAEGRQVGPARPAEIPPVVLMEAPGENGEITNVEIAPALRISVTLPEGATSAELVEFGRGPSVVRLDEARASGVSPPHSTKAFPADGALPVVRLAVIAERFDDEALFYAQCQQLLDRIDDTVPFKSLVNAVGLIGLFWNTDPAAGQLSVPQPTTQPDLIYGDRDRAAALLRAANVPHDRAIVLINLPRRGGAGGDPKYPAWVTNTSSATDSWEQVAVHELGHAFGLGDEYQSQGPAGISSDLEPNISANPDPGATPWSTMVTAPSPPAPTAPTDGGAQFRTLVGTFEGARYQPTGLYRPFFTCMMRNTGAPFCPVCVRHIRSRLGLPEADPTP